MKGKLLHLLCLLCLLGGMSTRVSAQDYEAYELSNVSEIKTDGTEYLICEVKSSDNLRNFFLYASASSFSSAIVRPSSSTYTESAKNSVISAGDAYRFTFSSGSTSGKYKIKNKLVNKFIDTKSGTEYLGFTESGAIDFTIIKENDGFVLQNGGKYASQKKYTNYMYAASSSKDTYFKIFEIRAKQTTKVKFSYYDESGTLLNATPVEKEYTGTETVSQIAGVPDYVSATYYANENFDGDELSMAKPVANTVYYVRTSYKEGFPFTNSGSYYALAGENSYGILVYLITAETGYEKFIKVTGDWYNNFVLQDKSGNYLNNSTGTWESSESKFEVEMTDGSYLLKSPTATTYLKFTGYASNQTMTTKSSATRVQNMSNACITEYLLAWPTHPYVGSYYQGQAGLTMDKIANSEAKVELSSDKYYFLELHNGTTDAGKQLTSASTTYQLLPNVTPTYAFTAAASTTNNFPSLWKIAEGNLTNLNAASYNLGTGVTLSYQGVDAKNHGLYTIQNGNDQYLYYFDESSVIFGSGTTYRNWALREVDESTIFTINLNEVGGTYYATLCAPIPLQATSEDFTVYTGELGNGNTELTLTKHTGVIPAGMPVMLISTASNTATFQYATTVDNYNPNDAWKGTFIDLKFADEATAKNYRTLGKGGAANTAGFYTPGVTTKIPANRAYIEMPSASETQAMLPIRFDDGTLTWIDASILTGEQTDNAAIYDLSGRRIMQPQRGQLYIRGGKKFIAQ